MWPPLHSTRVRIHAPRYEVVELLRQWNLYTNTRVKEHYDNYKLLKDVLHRPRQRSLDELRKIKYEEFLEKPLGHIIHL